MPTLLQIDSCLGVLSTGRITEGIAKVAMSQGWECYIAHGARYVGSTIQKSFQIETKKGEYIHYAKSLLFDVHGLGSKNATKKLVDYIKEIEPNVIQLHCIHGYYLNYKVLFEYLAKANIPIVWTQHDCWAFTGHCAHFVTANCEKWKTGCFSCPLKKDYPKALLDNSQNNYSIKKELFTSMKNMTIVSVSKWLDSVVNMSFLSKYPHKYIYNGIDTHCFKPYDGDICHKYGIETQHYLLAVASAWSNNKGLNDYVKLSDFLPSDYCIVLVGVGNDVKQKLPPQIVAIPRTDNKEELAMLYSKAAFVTSLSYGETMGLTVVEGLACGTPAIVYDNTAQPEMVSEDVGYVIPTGNYQLIVDVISNERNISQKDKDIRKEACIQRARKFYNEQNQYNQYIELYNSIISNHNSINNRRKPPVLAF